MEYKLFSLTELCLVHAGSSPLYRLFQYWISFGCELVKLCSVDSQRVSILLGSHCDNASCFSAILFTHPDSWSLLQPYRPVMRRVSRRRRVSARQRSWGQYQMPPFLALSLDWIYYQYDTELAMIPTSWNIKQQTLRKIHWTTTRLVYGWPQTARTWNEIAAKTVNYRRFQAEVFETSCINTTVWQPKHSFSFLEPLLFDIRTTTRLSSTFKLIISSVHGLPNMKSKRTINPHRCLDSTILPSFYNDRNQIWTPSNSTEGQAFSKLRQTRSRCSLAIERCTNKMYQMLYKTTKLELMKILLILPRENLACQVWLCHGKTKRVPVNLDYCNTGTARAERYLDPRPTTADMLLSVSYSWDMSNHWTYLVIIEQPSLKPNQNQPRT